MKYLPVATLSEDSYSLGDIGHAFFEMVVWFGAAGVAIYAVWGRVGMLSLAMVAYVGLTILLLCGLLFDEGGTMWRTAIMNSPEVQSVSYLEWGSLYEAIKPSLEDESFMAEVATKNDTWALPVAVIIGLTCLLLVAYYSDRQDSEENEEEQD